MSLSKPHTSYELVVENLYIGAHARLYVCIRTFWYYSNYDPIDHDQLFISIMTERAQRAAETVEQRELCEAMPGCSRWPPGIVKERRGSESPRREARLQQMATKPKQKCQKHLYSCNSLLILQPDHHFFRYSSTINYIVSASSHSCMDVYAE